MRYLYNETFQPSWVEEKEGNALNTVDPMCIPTLPKETENEWVGAAEEFRGSGERRIPVVVVETAGYNKIVVEIKPKIETVTKISQRRTGKSTQRKRENWIVDYSNNQFNDRPSWWRWWLK